MSASADAPPAPATPSVPEGPAGDEATSRPGLGVAIGVELAKLSAQLPLRIAMAASVVVPIAVAVLMRAVDTRPADTLFGRWSGTTGFATSLLVLNWVAAWGVPLLSGLVAGDIFASEDRHGTWKALLTRSCTRTQLFLGKALAALLCVTGCFALLGAVSVLAGLVVVGHAPLVGLSGQLIPAGHAIWLVAASWLLCLLPTAAFVTMGLLFSIIGRNTMVGVLGPLLVALLFQLLEISASGNVVRAVLLPTPLTLGTRCSPPTSAAPRSSRRFSPVSSTQRCAGAWPGGCCIAASSRAQMRHRRACGTPRSVSARCSPPLPQSWPC